MTMKLVATIPQLKLPYREEQAVDGILGKRRKSAIKEGPIDFSQCQLAKRYPTIDDFLEEIHKQREAQKAGGPIAHQAVWPPSQSKDITPKRDAPPWEDGPSAHDVRLAYRNTKQ